jgi:hypothetical protein
MQSRVTNSHKVMVAVFSSSMAELKGYPLSLRYFLADKHLPLHLKKRSD